MQSGWLFLLSMDSTNFLIWNARGLNGRARRDIVRKVVDACKPSLDKIGSHYVQRKMSSLAWFRISKSLSI